MVWVTLHGLTAPTKWGNTQSFLKYSVEALHVREVSNFSETMFIAIQLFGIKPLGK